MSNIGFNITRKEEISTLAEKVAPLSIQINAKNGFYLQYTDESGSELWLQINNEDEFIGFTPHFKGKSRKS